ncbi:DNA-packaging protein [Escherichia coli]|nr:DNA-packaging protein [Escherichia coli]
MDYFSWFDGVHTCRDKPHVDDNYYHFAWVLSGDPTGYGAATSRVFAIYENFPGSMSGFSAS